MCVITITSDSNAFLSTLEPTPYSAWNNLSQTRYVWNSNCSPSQPCVINALITALYFCRKKNWKPSERLLPLGNPMIRCSYFCKKCSAVINVEIPHGFLGVRWMVLNVSLWTAYFYRYKERYEAIALSLSILLMKFDNFKILLNSFWTSCFSDTIEPLNL